MFVHHISFFLLFHIEFWYHPSLLPEICVTFLAAITFETCLADVEVPAACIILIGLFALQHYGTHRVGFLFAPVIITWLFCLSTIGIYNIFYWNPHVYKALSPYYAFQLLRKTQKGGWMALGGILLCITGWSVCLMINLDVMPIWCQYSYVSIVLLQDQKPCLLILGTLHNYQSRYAISISVSFDTG